MKRKLVLLAGMVIIFLSLIWVGARILGDRALAQATARDGSTRSGNFPEVDFSNAIFTLSPAFQPETFVECVDNPYFPLIPGTVFHYLLETEEGTEKGTVTATGQTKEILGIRATVVHDVVEVNGELKEETFDWYAQDDRGNVWYLGEDTKEYENGKVTSTGGSWEAGVDGATGGIIMLGDPRVGDVYRQEYFEGEAEDLVAVVSLSETVTVPHGSFENALVTADFNPLSGEVEHKFYVDGIGLVKEESSSGSIANILIDITQDSNLIDKINNCKSVRQ